jgi:hypothetical protein
MEELIVRLANENPRWGYGKIEGELLKLGFKVSQTTIRKHAVLGGVINDYYRVQAGSSGYLH